MSPGTRVTPGFSRGSPSGRFQAVFGMVSTAQPLEAAKKQTANARISFDDRFNLAPKTSKDRLVKGNAQEHQERSYAESIRRPIAAEGHNDEFFARRPNLTFGTDT